MTMRSIDIKPRSGNSLHSKLAKQVTRRINLSEQRMSSRYEDWRRLERKYLLYRQPNDKDQAAEVASRNGDDSYRSIDVSFSYTLMMTAHAYYANTFLNRPVIFPVDSLNGDGAIKEQMVESLLQYQVRAGNMIPNLMVWLLDVSRYGISFIWDYWDEEYNSRAMVEEVPELEDGVETGKSKTMIRRERIPGYKGNKLFNILPFDALPDPRVPMIKVQEGEFFGRRVEIQWNDYLKRYERGEYVNKEAARDYLGTGTKEEGRRESLLSDSQDEDSYTHLTSTVKGKKVGTLDAIEMVIDLVPSEWELGSSDISEKWIFTIVNKKLLIGARPLGRVDDRFPVHVLEQEIDGYYHNSRGLLEINEDMNDVLSWLFNSHMYNKEQSIYNQFVFDPSRLVTKDLTRRDPGKMIRLKPTAYGTDVRSTIHQLPVNDVTQSNYGDTQVVEQMMQRTVGINDDVAGTSSGSSRRSATEFRGTTQFSADRLSDSALYFSATGFQSLVKSLISTSLDNYTDEVKVKIAGDNIPTMTDPQTGQSRIQDGAFIIDVEDLAGEYDLLPTDGSAPIDRGLQSQLYLQYMQQAMQIPGFAEQYRLPELMHFIMKNAGLRGLDRFKFNVMSDEQLQALVAQERQSGTGQTGQDTGGLPGADSAVGSPIGEPAVQADGGNGGAQASNPAPGAGVFSQFG